jgi:GNAT superfamily N-acetyltransferase
MPDLCLRAIAPGDAAAVSALAAQLGYSRTPAQILEWIETLHRDPRPQCALVACLGEEVVGWIDVSIERHLQSAPYALIGGLVVQDGYRGSGIGRALCQRAETWAWQQGVDTLRVTSRSTRADAHRFYLRDGYTQIKTSLVFEKPRPR